MRTIKFRGKRLKGIWKINKSITQLENGNIRLHKQIYKNTSK